MLEKLAMHILHLPVYLFLNITKIKQMVPGDTESDRSCFFIWKERMNGVGELDPA